MSEKTLQKLIDHIAADSRKAESMAKDLWGPKSQLFCESDELFAMDGDEDEGMSARMAHIRLHAKGPCPIGGGGW